jgi:hypothetical protein
LTTSCYTASVGFVLQVNSLVKLWSSVIVKDSHERIRPTQYPTKAIVESGPAAARTYTLNTSERAYIAGFLDRSCFVGIIRYSDKGRPKYTVRINVQCSNRQTLKPLRALVGGSIKKRRQTFVWSLGGRKRCAELFSLLLPHLQVRKKSAERVIQFDREWTRVKYPYEDCLILEHRDRFV